MKALEPALRVLHLDHTQVPGGAELALRRVLMHSTLWHPYVLIPPQDDNGAGVFDGLERYASVRETGPGQTSGASKSGFGVVAIKFGIGIFRQAIAIRVSREFRHCNLVHANTSRAALYGALACLGTKKKLVVHLRDGVDVPSLGQIGFTVFTRLALRRADGVIANARYTLSSAAPYLRPGSVTEVITSPIGMGNLPIAPIRDKADRIGMVARLDSWKGQELLMRAFAEAFPQGPIRLVLAGAPAFGNEHFLQELRVLARILEIDDRVDFLGHVDDVRVCIDSLDVCVQASIRPEPLGQNVLQYLIRGRPVIAADEGGPTEWITSDQNGLLFKSRDQHSLATALLRVERSWVLRSRLSQQAIATQGILNDQAVANAHFSHFTRVAKSERQSRIEFKTL